MLGSHVPQHAHMLYVSMLLLLAGVAQQPDCADIAAGSHAAASDDAACCRDGLPVLGQEAAATGSNAGTIWQTALTISPSPGTCSLICSALSNPCKQGVAAASAAADLLTRQRFLHLAGPHQSLCQTPCSCVLLPPCMHAQLLVTKSLLACRGGPAICPYTRCRASQPERGSLTRCSLLQRRTWTC